MMTKKTTRMTNHICRRMMRAVRMSPPRILRSEKLEDRGASPSIACSAITCFSSSLSLFSLGSSVPAWTYLLRPPVWTCLLYYLPSFLFCDSKFGTSASWVSFLLFSVRDDYLIVDKFKRCFYSAEEVLRDFSLRIA